MKDNFSKFEKMYALLVNGQITDYKASLKKLTKLEMLQYIEFACGQYGVARHVTMAYMRSALER